MAWARPSSPVSTARSGRTMGSGRKSAVVAAQPRQQPGPQKRRLARPRRAEDHEQRLHPRGAHPAQHIQAAQDLGVAPEEHRRIGLLQRCPPPIRGAVRIARRRPREVLGPDPQRAQPVQQPLQAHRWPTPPARPPSTMSTSVVGPSSGNRSQRCHSEVMSVSGTGSSRAHRIVLFSVSA